MCFLIKESSMTKNLTYMIDFLCQIEILLLNMLKIPGFLATLANDYNIFFIIYIQQYLFQETL